MAGTTFGVVFCAILLAKSSKVPLPICTPVMRPSSATPTKTFPPCAVAKAAQVSTMSRHRLNDSFRSTVCPSSGIIMFGFSLRLAAVSQWCGHRA
jgi:hypothetical protein